MSATPRHNKAHFDWVTYRRKCCILREHHERFCALKCHKVHEIREIFFRGRVEAHQILKTPAPRCDVCEYSLRCRAAADDRHLPITLMYCKEAGIGTLLQHMPQYLILVTDFSGCGRVGGSVAVDRTQRRERPNTQPTSSPRHRHDVA